MTIIKEDGTEIKIKSGLPIKGWWDEQKKCFVFEYTHEDKTKKKYFLRKSYKDGLVLN